MAMPDKILVIRFSSLGDLVLLVPTLIGLKKAIPEARIDFLTKKRYAELFEGATFIDRLLTIESGKISELLFLARDLSDENYDIVIDAHGVIRSKILYAMLRAKKKISIRKSELAKFMLITARIRTHGNTEYQIERYSKILERLGITAGDTYSSRLPLPAEAREKARRLIAERFGSNVCLVAFAPGARWETKRWPRESFARLIEGVANAGFATALIGGSEDRELCSSIAGFCPAKPIDLCGKLSVLESAAFLERCSALATNDSAPLHLAESVGTPVIAFFGPNVREFGYFPRLPESIALEKRLSCRPCSRNGSKPCPLGTKECLSSISVEEALEATLKIASRSGRHA